MENYKNAMEEHEEGTVIPLDTKQQLQEKFDQLQIKMAEGNITDEERLELEAQANEIEEELGLQEGTTPDADEEKLAA